MSSRHQDYIDTVRRANKQVWEGLNTLATLQKEWNALDYGNTLSAGEGANEGISKAQVGAVVFDTANALLTTLAAGSATNMAHLL